MKVLEKAMDVFVRRPRRMPMHEYLLKLKEKGLHPDGTAVMDPVPIAPPIGYKRHPSMVEVVRDMVRSEQLRAAAEASGAETFEEADDFEVDDEYFPHSEWENEFDPPIEQLVAAGRAVVAEREGRPGHSSLVRGDNLGSEGGEEEAAERRPAPKPGPTSAADSHLPEDGKE